MKKYPPSQDEVLGAFGAERRARYVIAGRPDVARRTRGGVLSHGSVVPCRLRRYGSACGSTSLKVIGTPVAWAVKTAAAPRDQIGGVIMWRTIVAVAVAIGVAACGTGK